MVIWVCPENYLPKSHQTGLDYGGGKIWTEKSEWIEKSDKSGPVESGPRLSSFESGPRLPSEKSGQVAAAAMVAAAGALAPAGAYGVNAGMARARQSRARAIAGVAKAPAGAKAPAAAATIAAAATWADFSDGNLGPDSMGPNP